MYLEFLAFILQMLKQYVLANDFHSNHQFETPYSTLHYFSPIACLLLSTCGFVALITANISRESHSMEDGFVCCSAIGHSLDLVVFLHQIAHHSTVEANMMVSNVEFNTFHKIDRELYAVLVMSLWRDPVEAMQIMALWLWLERVGFRNVVKKIVSLPTILVNELADEAAACLSCITNDQFVCSSENNDIPLMHTLMEKEISLKFVHDNRLIAAQGISRIINEVCVRALTDIMQVAVERNAAQSLIDSQKLMAPSFQQPLYYPVGVHQQMLLQPPTQETEVPPEARTMFVTFSKGYPVLEREVHEFFTRGYGDCIETLNMQEVQPTEQSLFAKIVFRSAATIDVILNGVAKAKFTINSKHVWARKFVPKRP